MKLDLVTLSNILKHGDVLIELLRGGNTPQTVGKIKDVLGDAGKLVAVLRALDGLEQNLRVVKAVDLVIVATPED